MEIEPGWAAVLGALIAVVPLWISFHLTTAAASTKNRPNSRFRRFPPTGGNSTPSLRSTPRSRGGQG